MDRNTKIALDTMQEALDRARLRDSSRDRAYRRTIALLLIIADFLANDKLDPWQRARWMDLRSIFHPDILAAENIERDDFWKDIIIGLNEDGIELPKDLLIHLGE